MHKSSLLDASSDGANCTVWSTVQWESITLWKAVPSAGLAATQQAFRAATLAAMGYTPGVTPMPASGAGLKLYSAWPVAPVAGSAWPLDNTTVEVLHFTVQCSAVDHFFETDNSTWTRFLAEKPGFTYKSSWVDPQPAGGSSSGGSTCAVWTRTYWTNRSTYQAACGGAAAEGCQAVHKAFVAAFGADPPLQRWPSAAGLTQTTSASPEYPGAPTI